MTAAEIRAEAAKNVEAFRDHIEKNLLHPITVADYVARMEIAAQLAELNVSLRPIRSSLDGSLEQDLGRGGV
jgi:hypothetical protein